MGHIADITYRRWLERDEREGVESTPAHRNWLRDLALDYEQEMVADARMEKANAEPEEPEDEEEHDDG